MITFSFILFSVFLSHADDESLWVTTVTPDVLIIQDLSGSMDELPQGSTATFYLHGSSSCSTGGPFYTSAAGTDCLSATTLYGTSCSATGPFYTTDINSIPQGNLYIAGTSCTADGPYATSTSGLSNLAGAGSTVYTASSSKCSSGTSGGPFYKTSSSSYPYSCAVSNMPSTIYATTCSDGPWYRSSSTGRATCYKSSTLCTTPLASSTTVYTASDCSVGPWYKTSGTGHTTACINTTGCSISTIFGGSVSATSTLYSASDCISGPFHENSSTTYSTPCYASCNNACSKSTSNYVWSATSTCDGPFYSSSGTGHTTNCSKLEIAKRAIFGLMDANGDDSLTATDVTALGLRLGYMRYYNCSSADNSASSTPWTSGCEKVIWGITQSDNTTTTPYANIYCNDSTCASTATACTGSGECVVGFSATGGTPLGDSIREGKLYLDYHKSLDASATCRPKSIIVITDGADTYSCGGNGSSTNISQRRAPVYYSALANAANYKVYVVGFGASMPSDLQNTLNWTAYQGGTRNPNATQSGNTSALSVGTDPCSNGGDPASYSLSGYAFMASNPDELSSALQSAITSIQEATYSFSQQASVAAARTSEENYLYEASFDPRNNAGTAKEPFWPGHLKKYYINADTGALTLPACWDAGTVLRDMDADSRHMYTLKNGTMTAFTTSNITAADLGISTSTTQTVDSVVGFYRGDTTYNLENWKLGDLFHTNPVVIKTPSSWFYDPRESGSTSFATFRTNHQRASASGNQIILVGANDGQVHAFQTGTSTTCTSGASEIWSFFPPNLLQKIAPIAHYDHSSRISLSSHDYFVDGPLKNADVWIPSSDGTGATKTASDWKSIAIFGEGQGSGAYLWSSSSNCYSTSTSAFSATYDATNYPYYCGLYALNVTDTANTYPTYMWHLMPTSSQAPFLGEAWSKMQVNRIKDGANEKWVGFVGGGFNAQACLSADGGTSYSCDTPANYSAGKSFAVVDLRDGTILWQFKHGASTTVTTNPNMDFAAPGSPFAVDWDADGFVDTVYMGDMGGNIWRFRLCSRSSGTTCTHSSGDWSGSLFFQSTNVERGSTLSTAVNTHKQIFTSVTGTIDTSGNAWIYWGTGENNEPTTKPTDTSSTKNRLYALKEDPNFAATYTSANLTNVTTTVSTAPTGACDRGWYYNLSTNSLTRSDGTTISSPLGEKMISDPTVFNGIVYFPTYVPDQGSSNACGLAGDAFLYKFNYLCPYSSSLQSVQYVGHGIPSSVLLSYRPGYTMADIYITASGGGGTGALTQNAGSANVSASMNNLLFWKDKRLQ